MKSIQIYAREARAIVPHLIDLSLWFEVTPLPFDVYEIAVKDDALPQLDIAVDHVRDMEC